MPRASQAPRVSILLPARDAAATLPTCLASLARQRERDFECVLVDDGSRDDTLAIARDFARADPRVRVLACEARGLVDALGTGLAECRAPLVARMDADDWMHRDRLALQCDALDAEPDLAAVGAHVRIFPRARLSEGRRAYERWLNGISTPAQVRAERFVECPVAHPTLCIRRGRLQALGYRSRGWPEDWDLLLRLLAGGESIAVLPRRLLAWRDTPGRLSRNDPAYALERFTECRAAFLADDFLARDREYVLWGHGGTGRALRRALARHGRTPSHIVELHPGRLGQRIHGAAVVRPEALQDLRPRKLIASVAGAEPRARIRRALSAMGFAEGRDFVCAA